ncbi:MAG: 50S ribosomal protein L11 methyltransferase [Allosphingosinicella sp.]|uniref:50S ribosomal protein L11 methyltransferase n=1 Tax=Allosphingosinicella sp. TaxID=2823234 RepID=UPI003942FDE5
MTWKLTLPCTKAEAEQLGSDISPLALMDEPPTLMTSEETEESWRLDAYFEAKPGKGEVAALQALVPSAAGAKPVIEQLPEEDWVTLSQQGLEPIHAGRFFVHTPAHRGSAPEGAVALEIDAGRAFGTGQHETTTGCLIALDRLKREGFIARNLVDVGTGTGLLAFAGLRLWPGARATASDIDPVAVEVTRENAAINAVRLGRVPGALDTVTAPGLNHPRLKARAPYDLIIANILAGPLVGLAPSLAKALAPGGRIILAGLLTSQAARVEAAYRREGLRSRFTITRGDWPTLVLRRPR